MCACVQIKQEETETETLHECYTLNNKLYDVCMLYA